MKNKFKKITVSSILFIFSAISSVPGIEKDKNHNHDYIDTNEILDIMEFPGPTSKIGRALNDPLFYERYGFVRSNPIELKKRIQLIEKDLITNSKCLKFYELGNCYRDLSDFENAVKYYKKYLQHYLPDSEFNEKLFITGDVYYNLAEFDTYIDRIPNLQKALSYFCAGLKMNSDNMSLLVKAGDCSLALGYIRDALYYYRKGLEKKGNESGLLARLQSAVFEDNFLKLQDVKCVNENFQITDGLDLSYIDNAINLAPSGLKDSFKTQRYIYLLRLLLVKDSCLTADEKKILSDADNFFKTVETKNVNTYIIRYLTGIVKYLNSDYKKALSIFESMLNENIYADTVHDEILFLSYNILKDYSLVEKTIYRFINTNPLPEDYLVLADLSFKNKNSSKALMFCYQAIKSDKNCAGAYSALSLIYSHQGNYTAADEMIKKGKRIFQKTGSYDIRLYNHIIINEAAIALLKREKERAYILLQTVLTVDSNDKALFLYNRYFKNNEKIQN